MSRQARATRSLVSQASGVVPSSAWKRRCRVAGLMAAWVARSATVSGLVQPCSGAQASSGASDVSGDRAARAVDELPLAAVAVRGEHQPPADRVGDLGAVVAADEVQAEVERGGAAGGGEDVAVVDEQDVGFERTGGNGPRTIRPSASAWSPGGRRARPAAARVNAPVQKLTSRAPRAAARRMASSTSGAGATSGSGRLGTIRVSARSRLPGRPCRSG